MKKYLIVDVATQKKYVESFGSEAVPFASVVRENFMHITSLSIRQGLPMLSILIPGDNQDMDEKVMDTVMESQIFDKEIKNGYQTICVSQDIGGFDFSGYEAIFVFGIGINNIKDVVKEFKKNQTFEGKIWLIEDAFKDNIEELEEKFKANCKAELEVWKITTRNLEKYIKM